MGLVSGITGIFAASAQEDAYNSAINTLKDAQGQAYTEAGKLSTQFDPMITDAMNKLGISFDTMQKFLTQAQGIDVGAPLNDQDKIAMQDAQRLMNENMSKTGNLRSGAASYANEELTRRVIADATANNFNRQIAKSQLLLGGGQALSGIAATVGNMGMSGKSMAENMFSTGLSFAPQIAQAQVGQGAAVASGIMSMGDLGDSLLSGAATAGMGYMGGLQGMGMGTGATGAMSGFASSLSPNMMPMMMMSQYFKGTNTTH